METLSATVDQPITRTRQAIARGPADRQARGRLPDAEVWGPSASVRNASVQTLDVPLVSDRADIQDSYVSQTIVNNVNVNIQNNYFNTPRYRPTYFFDSPWYRSYPRAWYPVHPISPRVWWEPAPAWGYTWRWFYAGVFAHCVVDRLLPPMPYYYGTNVYYVDDMVYVNGEPFVPASVYYTQAAEIAARGAPQAPISIIVNVEAPGTAPANAEQLRDDWMPMGTFAVLDDPEAASTPIVIQLATNRLGQVAGNVINMQTDEITPVYGAVDPETQRVAMRVEGRTEIAECGLWNLTQDTLTVLLHVDEATTEERTFVRLSDPDQEELAP